MKHAKKALTTVIISFIIVNLVVWLIKSFLIRYGFDINFILAANCLLFVMSICSSLIFLKAIRSLNVQAFIRGIYTSMLLKLFVCMISISIYLIMLHGSINQPALFTSMALYILYTTLEVSASMKAVRNKDA